MVLLHERILVQMANSYNATTKTHTHKHIRYVTSELVFVCRSLHIDRVPLSAIEHFLLIIYLVSSKSNSHWQMYMYIVITFAYMGYITCGMRLMKSISFKRESCRPSSLKMSSAFCALVNLNCFNVNASQDCTWSRLHASGSVFNDKTNKQHQQQIDIKKNESIFIQYISSKIVSTNQHK